MFNSGFNDLLGEAATVRTIQGCRLLLLPASPASHGSDMRDSALHDRHIQLNGAVDADVMYGAAAACGLRRQ